MTTNRKNVLVGVVVLGALVLLAWMILRFGGQMAAPFAAAQMPVRFVAERADGLFEGSSIYYRGVPVGRVVSVSRMSDQTGVFIDAVVDQNPPPPANVYGDIRSQGLLATGVVINLELTDSAPQGQLAPDTRLQARFSGNALVPPQFEKLATELEMAVKDFRQSRFPQHLDEAVVAIRDEVTRAGKVLQSVQDIVGDEHVRQNLRDTVENIQRTSATASDLASDLRKLTERADQTLQTSSASIDEVSQQLSRRLQQLGHILGDFQTISARIEQGQGTAGMLVNDPRLYQAMVDSSRELAATITDLKRLVEQWEQEGVSFKLR